MPITNRAPRNRASTLIQCVAAALVTFSFASTAVEAQQLMKVRTAGGTRAITPLVINHVMGEYLGWFKEEGMTVEAVPLGSDAAMVAALESGRVEFIDSVPSFVLPQAAKGTPIRPINFFQYTYPFKYALATKPGSPIKTLADLKGKKIGVISLGVSDFPVGKTVVKIAGLDPEKDVSWLAVGEGITAGVALDRGDVDALFSIDVVFGTIESAGIKMVFVPLPPNLPKIGGVYLATMPEFIKSHRSIVVGFARVMAKSHVFIQENPEAAAYVFAQMYPEALPKGVDLAQQVKAVMVPVAKRMPLYSPYDPSVKMGFIKAAEWQDEINFLGLQDQVKDPSKFFTNELIDEINAFDREKVKAQAREFKLPYKK